MDGLRARAQKRAPARPPARGIAEAVAPRNRAARRARAHDRGARRTSWSRQRAVSRDLLDVHEERLELRRSRVRVTDKWRERVGEPVLRQLWVPLGGYADEAPVDRYPDLIDRRVPGELHWPEPFGHESRDLELAARAGDAHAISVLDALRVGQLLRDLHEGLRLETDEERHVLRHVVLVLGQPVARSHVGVLVDLAE